MQKFNGEKTLLALVDFLQDATDIAERLDEYSDEATDNNPEGEFAQVERWLREELDRGSYDIGDLYYSLMNVNK